MKISNYTHTGSRKEFLARINMFKLKSYCFPIMVLVLMLASCKEAKPQTPKERKEAQKVRVNSDFEQFYLGTIKMCLDTDYSQYFGDYREINHSPKNRNCCTGLVPAPYIDPYEFYLVIKEEEKSLYENQANPFEMKKIRDKLKGKKEEIYDIVKEIDVNNLVKHSSCMFIKYDMAKEEIKFRAPPKLSFRHSGRSIGFGEISIWLSTMGVNTIGMPNEITLSLDSDKAENLFDYYEKNSPAGKLVAYSSVNARITYVLKFPERNTTNSKFDALVKKIEFFPKDNWTDKIGEITL